MRRRLTIRREHALSVLYTEGPIELYRTGEFVCLALMSDRGVLGGNTFTFRAEDVVIEVETL